MGITQLEAVPDPSLEITEGGGGGAGHPDPYKTGGGGGEELESTATYFLLFHYPTA